jgi:acyl carrier protein
MSAGTSSAREIANEQPARPASIEAIRHSLVQMWQELLGIDEVDPTADFFDLGGNSLTAIKLLSRVDATYGADALSPDTLFASAQLDQLASAIATTLQEREAR